MTTKTLAQYTPEQTSQMLEQFATGASVEAIATSVGKSVRSVIAKLSREGVYKAKARDTSTRVTKAQLVAAIAAKYDVSAEKLESLEKASKEALEILAA